MLVPVKVLRQQSWLYKREFWCHNVKVILEQQVMLCKLNVRTNRVALVFRGCPEVHASHRNQVVHAYLQITNKIEPLPAHVSEYWRKCEEAGVDCGKIVVKKTKDSFLVHMYGECVIFFLLHVWLDEIYPLYKLCHRSGSTVYICSENTTYVSRRLWTGGSNLWDVTGASAVVKQTYAAFFGWITWTLVARRWMHVSLLSRVHDMLLVPLWRKTLSFGRMYIDISTNCWTLAYHHKYEQIECVYNIISCEFVTCCSHFASVKRRIEAVTHLLTYNIFYSKLCCIAKQIQISNIHAKFAEGLIESSWHLGSKAGVEALETVYVDYRDPPGLKWW